MDLQGILAELATIKDPVEKKRRQAELMAQLNNMTPARAATSDVVKKPPVPIVPPADTSQQPTVKNMMDHQQLVEDAQRGDRILTENRMSAFSDEDLQSIIENPAASTINPGAQAEVAQRKRIDAGGPLSMGDASADLLRAAGQVVGGTAELPTSGPVGMLGILEKGAELATGKDLGANDTLLAAEAIRQSVRQTVGISDPRNAGESAAGLLAAITPIPGVSSPVGIIKNVAEVVTPLVVGSGPKRILANFAVGYAADQGLRELTDDANTEYKTAFDRLGVTGGELDKAYPETANILAIGVAGMAGAGIVTPIVGKALRESSYFKDYRPVDIKDVDIYGPDNLKTLERAGDQTKAMFVDEKQVLQDLYKRAGAPDYDKVSKLIDQDTQMAALMRVNEAMRTGTLRTKSGSYQVNITPNQLFSQYARLPPAMQTDVDMYLKLKDYEDILKRNIANNKNLNNSTTALQQTRRDIFDLETRTPEAMRFSAAYSHITGAVRDFLGQGDHAMLSPKALQKLQTTRQNFVPTDVLSVDPTSNVIHRVVDVTAPHDQRNMDNWYRQNPEALAENPAQRPNSFEMLVDYTRNALKAKMEHDVRGAYVKGMLNSEWGHETVRVATKADIAKYRDRLINVWEGGKRKTYITSKLQANLLRMDPYVARFPTTFAVKRIAENFMTGPASLTFAPVSALRDSVGGWVFAEKGAKGPGSAAVALAIPKQVWAKTQLAAIEMLQNSMDRFIPFLPPSSRLQLAQQISNSYMNSFYHLANESGGFDASLMKHNIQQARGVFREVAKTTGPVAGSIPGIKTLGRSMSAMLHGWSNIFDAVQEAPRFSTFIRNVKAGKSPEEASRIARNLTGDTMRSGRVFNPQGRRIDVDAQNKGAKLVNSALAYPLEYIRESTPYFNPMVQSMRKMMNAFIDNPVQANIRAWTAVGLPGLISMGWNEMLGEEYNRHAFETRSSRDIANNLYIGIPGLPPEKGIQIPMPLELTMFNSPWTTGIYSLMRGDNSEDMKASMMHIAGTNLENTAMVGFPQLFSVGLATAGVKTPQSLLNPMAWGQEAYKVEEDNVGLLPQNAEMVLRSLFGSVTDTVLQSAAAFHEAGPQAFFDELGYQVLKRTPIAKAAVTTPVTNFTPLSELKETKINALQDFLDMYTEQVKHATNFRDTALPTTKGITQDTDASSTYRASPIPSPAISNPIILEYGDLIKSVLDTNAVGMTGLKARDSLYRQQVKNLRAYTAGRKDAFRAWQRGIVGKDQEYQAAITKLGSRDAAPNKKEYDDELKGINNGLGEAAKLDRLVTKMKLDLGRRSDVEKLIAVLERERVEMIKEQLKLVNVLEDKMTGILQQRGLMMQGQKFDVTRHLGRLMPRDLAQ